MKKNPILRNKFNAEANMGCGDIWSEVNENVDLLENVNGGTAESTALIALSIYVGYEKLSIALGNPGSYCTLTDECINNCRN